MEVLFHCEEIDFTFKEENELIEVVQKISEGEKIEFDSVNCIFCSDEYLKNINVTYLKRDYYTDIITFPYLEEKVSGDIFISIDRIIENAKDFETGFDNELRRVLIHGFLHLCNYEDYDSDQKKIMTNKEDHYLNFF